MKNNKLQIKNKFNFIFLCVFYFLNTCYCIAENDKKISEFQKALVSAYTNNEDFHSKIKAELAAMERVPKALAGWHPNISISAQSSAKRIQPKSGFADIQHSSSLGINLSQNIFQGGGTIAEIRSAESYLESRWANFINTEQTMLLQASDAYLNLVVTSLILKFKEIAEKNFKTSLDATKTMAEVGEKTPTDVALAEASFAGARSETLAAKSNFESAKAQYERIIGENPPINPEFPTIDNYVLLESKEQIIKLAIKQNPTIQKAILEEKSSQHNINVAKSKFLPKVDVIGSMSRSGSSETPSTIFGRTYATKSYRWSNEFTARIQLTVPIYTPGVWPGYREATQQSAQQKTMVSATKKTINESIIKSWETWQSNKKRIEFLKAEIKYAKLSAEGTKEQFALGEKSLLHVIEAENKLLNAKINLAQAKKNEINSMLQLLSLIGKMTVDSLNLPVKKYDIKKYYKDIHYRFFGKGTKIEGLK